MRKKNFYKKKAFELRQKLLSLVIENGGHLSTSLSCLDIMVALYYGKIIRFKASAPNWINRDRFLISKGHAETITYLTLKELGFISETMLSKHYRKGKFKLGGHIDCSVPGIEFSTGSLGHGLNLACGTALGLKKKKNKSFTFVLMSDGECTEGTVWEAAIFAKFHKLNNLIAIIDYNNISATDFTKNFTSNTNLVDKFKSFGWKTFSVDGHNIDQMIKKFNKIKSQNLSSPVLILAKTIKGKGIKFIENDPARHTKGLNNNEFKKAKKILKLL